MPHPSVTPRLEPDPHDRWRHSIWAAPALVLLSVGFILTNEDAWGGGFAQWLNHAFEEGALEFLNEFVAVAEMYGSKPGLILVPLLILLLDREGMRKLGMVLRGFILKSLMVQVTKVLFGRMRPPFDRRDGYVIPEDAKNVGEWFGPDGGPWGSFRLDQDWLSYPSGHTASAVLFACFLTRFYPRGAAIWWFLTALCVGHRIMNARHFVSDAFAGAAIAVVAFWLTRPGGPIDRAWMRWRARKKENGQPPPSQ